ncbi:hypothetical protein JJC00_17415 [Bradyrhizobium diazoefficiens]|uniref:hypothetical protein n=1 Tax=Bradyrhizobium diazoefficiens TaxID=1355477 RepID=UPI00190AD740|nr:hypothetical protein [Bradyrhizobium diazoefficiens]QQO37227.1 hypothetical protein JJC00_17415 [Bradyrhizobium diazoefficiens]
MQRNRERRRTALRWFVNRLAAVALLALTVPVTPSLAQASGDVRLKIVKAGLLVGGGVGRGVLTYRGRTYPFRLSGISLGITAGATIGRLEGRASGIRDVSDFAGSYSSVGGGAALVGGLNGVHLRNEKGVTMVLQGPKAGLEFAANISAITISLK